MNTKFNTLMEKTLEQIEDIAKRLSRPVKDLDDVRTAMAALLEIRENEIQIDMSLGPIEVSEGVIVSYSPPPLSLSLSLSPSFIGVLWCVE